MQKFFHSKSYGNKFRRNYIIGGQRFATSLNCLRGQPPPLQLLSAQELQQLKEDAEFYQFPALSLDKRPIFPIPQWTELCGVK